MVVCQCAQLEECAVIENVERWDRSVVDVGNIDIVINCGIEVSNRS